MVHYELLLHTNIVLVTNKKRKNKKFFKFFSTQFDQNCLPETTTTENVKGIAIQLLSVNTR